MHVNEVASRPAMAGVSSWPQNTVIHYEQDSKKRPGSAAFDRYEKYKKAQSIEEALQLGSLRADLKHDFAKGLLRKGPSPDTPSGSAAPAGPTRRVTGKRPPSKPASAHEHEDVADADSGLAADAEMMPVTAEPSSSSMAAPQFKRQRKLSMIKDGKGDNSRHEDMCTCIRMQQGALKNCSSLRLDAKKAQLLEPGLSLQSCPSISAAKSAERTLLLEAELPVNVHVGERACDEFKHFEKKYKLATLAESSVEHAQTVRLSEYLSSSMKSQIFARAQKTKDRIVSRLAHDRLRRQLHLAIRRGKLPSTPSSRKVSTGLLVEQSSSNELEAALCVKAADFGELLAAGNLSKQVSLGEAGSTACWTLIGPEKVDDAKGLGNRQLRDQVVCWQKCKSLDYVMHGTYVPEFFCSGEMTDNPWMIRSGLSFYLCTKCNHWVKRSQQEQHAVLCNGHRRASPQVWQQFSGEDLGLQLEYNHRPEKGKVHVSISLPVKPILKLANWSCCWEPDELQCSWRIIRKGSQQSHNQLPEPQSKLPSGALRNTVRLFTRTSKSQDAQGSQSADVPQEQSVPDVDEEMNADRDNDLPHCVQEGGEEEEGEYDDMIDLDDERPKGVSEEDEADDNRIDPKFQLQSSLDVSPAEQPTNLALPLKPEQLHTLGWMLMREGRSPGHDVAPYDSTQLFDRAIAETEVSVQLRIQRTYKHVRGGICGDSMGYGKTACFIALVADNLQDRIQAQVNFDEDVCCRNHIMTSATLVIAPPNLFDQWSSEFRKFVRPDVDLNIVAVPNHQKLKSLRVKDILKADVVIVSFRMFFSEAYRMYLDETVNPEVRGNLWDANRAEEIERAKKARQEQISNHGKPERAKIYAPSYFGEEAAKKRGYPEKEEEPHGRWRFFRWKAGSNTPARKVSSEYKHLMSDSAYCAKRYAHLEQHVQDLLGGSCEELLEAKALFEMFYWKRVCFDEFHEAVRVKVGEDEQGARRATVFSLHALTGRYMWGLTGTPLISSPEAVADMASLLHIFTPPNDKEQAQNWLNEWVRSNTWDKSSVATEDHWVRVSLTKAEQALYLNQRNIVQGSRNADGQMARHAEERLLQLCTHFDPEGDRAQGVEDALSLTMEHQAQQLQRAEEGIGECEMKLADIKARVDVRSTLNSMTSFRRLEMNRLVCAHVSRTLLASLGERALHEQVSGWANSDDLRAEVSSLADQIEASSKMADLLQATQQADQHQLTVCANFRKHDGECQSCANLSCAEEHVKFLNRSKGMHEGKKREMDSQIRFLKIALESLNGKSFECSICMEDTDQSGKDVGVLTCGHAFHEDCIRQTLAENPLCPVCRQAASPEQITNVALHFGSKPGDEADGEAVAQPSELQLKCGSKIAAIIETIQQIQKGEGAATEKCVVFIQWDQIMRSLANALSLVGLPPLMLQGSTLQRQMVLRRFIDGEDSGSSILLLSLQQSPSGMNLVCARNLLLVHPMSARNRDEAINFERQAIGRVVRQGQRRKVRIYRFVTKDTVEEEITQRHHAEIFSAAMVEDSRNTGANQDNPSSSSSSSSLAPSPLQAQLCSGQ